MAITTVDGIVAGLQPPFSYMKITGTMEAAAQMHSLLYTVGAPGASSAPASGVNGTALTTYAGQIPFTNPVSGNTYLAGIDCASTGTGTLFLLDRIWHNSGLTVTTTTAQSFTTPTFPARDQNGSANGVGFLAAIEVSTATTNGSAITNTTMSYTNDANTSGRTATITSFPATAVAGSIQFFNLQAGDTGIRSIQSVTLGTSYGGGAIHIIVFRQLATISVGAANIGNRIDAISGGFVRMYDNSVPFFVWLPTATTTVNIFGKLQVAQG